MKHPLILGIETSCDETAAAVVAGDRRILANIVRGQVEDHQPFGGVVPEIAARAHSAHIDQVIRAAMAQANIGFAELDAVAATTGPGLIGGVIVGTMTGKAIAAVHRKPFLAINHLEGHALTVRLTDDVPFPYLLLLVSGGHCQWLAVEEVGKYHKLGATLDDALGEAFDKVAKMLGLGFPGGPQVEKLALGGDGRRFNFPRPLLGREGCDFSFSGLKTAVRNAVLEIQESGAVSAQDKADVCASFQHAVGEIVADRLKAALILFRTKYPQAKYLVVAGGVAANQHLRSLLEEQANANDMKLVAPPPALCTDNAAMIAWAGVERFNMGQNDSLESEPRARWPL